MGTRSLTVIHDGEKIVTVMYRQFDGYPSGHGAELKSFAENMIIVNGIGVKTPPKAANGMGCLAAQLVAHFKKEIGNIYLHSSHIADLGQDYMYFLYPTPANVDIFSNRRLNLCVVGYNNTCLYDGSVEGFNPDMFEDEDDMKFPALTSEQLSFFGLGV